MAQYVFDASKYPNGTLLSQLGWASGFTPDVDFQVVEIGTTGRKYWAVASGSVLQFATFGPNIADFEMLFLADFTQVELGIAMHGFRFELGAQAEGTNATFPSNIQCYVNSSNSFTWIAAEGIGANAMNTPTISNAPTGITTSTAIGLRYKYGSSGADLKVRAWPASVGGLEAAEPTPWNMESSLINTKTAAPITPFIHSGPVMCVSCISIGTGGASAPYPNPSQTVTTPSGLSVTNITATTADADWT